MAKLRTAETMEAIPVAFSLTHYRESSTELLRTASLARMIAHLRGDTAMDVGARDGHFSRLLAKQFRAVTALDLDRPSISHPAVRCESGDVTQLAHADNSFDLVVCTEVLEHLRPADLAAAGAHLMRVTRRHLLIGVPYRQDTRVGRTTCCICGRTGPPWGHLNSFDEKRLLALFPGMQVVELSFCGSNNESTNAISTLLMDLAGNPYGTYGQDEPCMHCGMPMTQAPARTFAQKLLTKMAFATRAATEWLQSPHPYWIHYLLRKPE